MAANIEIQDDTGRALTSFNFGAVNGGANDQRKFRIQNVGNSDAVNVSLFLQRLNANDGLDYAVLAEDINGNPGEFTRNVITVGSLPAGAIKYFWAKVIVPVGTTPAGNPRQFDAVVQYTGT
jgi:hypothetical protein